MEHNNAYHNYNMNGKDLQSVSEETDLGIIVSNDLKVKTFQTMGYVLMQLRKPI